MTTEQANEKTRFLSLVPVNQEIYAIFHDEEDPENIYRERIIFAGITEDGEIELIPFDSGGLFTPASKISNFKEFEFSSLIYPLRNLDSRAELEGAAERYLKTKGEDQ